LVRHYDWDGLGRACLMKLDGRGGWRYVLKAKKQAESVWLRVDVSDVKSS
jgi:hypothetical protein